MQYVTASTVKVSLALPGGTTTSYDASKLHLMVKSKGSKTIINNPVVANSTAAGVAGSITFDVPCSTDGMYYCTFSSTPGSTDLDAAVVPYDTLGSVMFNRVTPTSTVLK